MPTAASNQALTTGSATTLYERTPGHPATTFWVYNRSETDFVLVRCEPLHATDEWIGLAPQQGIPFRAGSEELDLVQAKAESGTPAVSCGIVARVALPARAT